MVCASSLFECLSGCHCSASLRYAERISAAVAVLGMERTWYGFISVGGEERSSVMSSVLEDFFDFFVEEDLFGIVDDGREFGFASFDAGSTFYERKS